LRSVSRIDTGNSNTVQLSLVDNVLLHQRLLFILDDAGEDVLPLVAALRQIGIQCWDMAAAIENAEASGKCLRPGWTLAQLEPQMRECEALWAWVEGVAEGRGETPA